MKLFSKPLLPATKISGISGIYSNSTIPIKNTTFSAAPYFGKEMDEHLLLGVQLDLRWSNFQAEDVLVLPQPTPIELIRKSNQFGLGIFARYILNPDNQFNFYLQPSVSYNVLGETETQNTAVTREEKATYVQVEVGGGFLYNINDTWRLTLGVGALNYVNGSWEIVDTDMENNFSAFGVGFIFSSLRFGAEMKW